MTDSTPPAVVPIETRWVRDRMRVPEVEALDARPPASEGEVEALRERLREVVGRIEDRAAATNAEIRQRAWYHGMGGITSAVIGVAAFFLAAAVPRIQLPAIIVAILELGSVFIFRSLQKRLARDLLAVGDLEDRYRTVLEAARTPEQLAAIAGRIRAEMEIAVGRPPIPASTS